MDSTSTWLAMELPLDWQDVPEALEECYEQFKQADAITSAARKFMQWTGNAEGTYPGGIPNYPNPLLATLLGGLAVGGAGYGAGMLAEKVLPESWTRGRLRKTLGLGGALLGATPGLVGVGTNLAHGLGPGDPRLLMSPQRLADHQSPTISSNRYAMSRQHSYNTHRVGYAPLR